MWCEGPPSHPHPHPSTPQGLAFLSPELPSTPPLPSDSLSSRLKSLAQKNSFWIHRVSCLGTEPHVASCQVQVAPARGKLRPACPGGMHAVVNCVVGPRFRPLKAKSGRKEPRAEVGPLGSHRSLSQQHPAFGKDRWAESRMGRREGQWPPSPIKEVSVHRWWHPGCI